MTDEEYFNISKARKALQQRFLLDAQSRFVAAERAINEATADIETITAAIKAIDAHGPKWPGGSDPRPADAPTVN